MTPGRREVFDLSRVLKQTLKHEKVQTVSFPSQWRPLAFANQNGDPTLWFEGDDKSEYTFRAIHLVFTGEEVPLKARYLGTATFGIGGAIVVHCYVTQ